MEWYKMHRQSDSDTNNEQPKPEPVTNQLPEPIAKHFTELYAEYVKPERFHKWLIQQEQLKLDLAKQQYQLEFQRQRAIAHAELYKLRNGWERDSDK